MGSPANCLLVGSPANCLLVGSPANCLEMVENIPGILIDLKLHTNKHFLDILKSQLDQYTFLVLIVLTSDYYYLIHNMTSVNWYIY